jgi:hypothetical protein
MLCHLVLFCVISVHVNAQGLDIGVLIDTSKNTSSLNLSASNSSILSNSTAVLEPIVGIASCLQPPCPEPTLAEIGTQLIEALIKPPTPNATTVFFADPSLWELLYSSNNYMNAAMIGGGLFLLIVFVIAMCCVHNAKGSRMRAYTRPRYKKILAVQLVRAV